MPPIRGVSDCLDIGLLHWHDSVPLSIYRNKLVHLPGANVLYARVQELPEGYQRLLGQRPDAILHFDVFT